jgi:hypothetical protein
MLGIHMLPIERGVSQIYKQTTPSYINDPNPYHGVFSAPDAGAETWCWDFLDQREPINIIDG